MCTPDLLFLARLVTGNHGPAATREYLWYQHEQDPAEIPYPSACHIVNRFCRAWGHLFIYDTETLRASMATAGFEEIVRRPVSKSDHEELRDLEPVGRLPKGLFAMESMTFEGVRPIGCTAAIQ